MSHSTMQKSCFFALQHALAINENQSCNVQVMATIEHIHRRNLAVVQTPSQLNLITV